MHANREDPLPEEPETPDLPDVPDPQDAPAEPAPAEQPSLPEGWEAVGKGSELVIHEKDAGAAAPLSTGMLLTVGVVAGVYLLFTVGWIAATIRLRSLPMITDTASLFAMVLGIAAPALWFAAAWLLTRRSKPWVRIAALAAGVVLLIPWPFVTFGWLGVTP